MTPMKKQTPPDTKKPSRTKTAARPAHPATTGKKRYRYRSIFTHSPAASAVVGEDGTFALVNERFMRLTGYRRKEIEGRMNWAGIASPDDAERLDRYTQELVSRDGHMAPPCTFCLRDRDGTMHPVQVTMELLPGTQQVLASFADNTAQKKTEQMLRSQESRYRILVNDIPVGMFRNRLRTPGRILWANPAFVRMYGFESLAQLLKCPVQSLYADPSDRDRFLELLENQGTVSGFEVQQKRKDGTVIWVRTTARTRKNREGVTEWVEGIVEDISAERAVQEAGGGELRLAHAAFHSSSRVAICTTDCSGTITLVNPAFEQLAGCPSADLVGKETPLAFLNGPELDARSRVLSEEAGHPVTGFAILSLPAQHAGSDERQWTWTGRDTRRIPADITIVPLMEQRGSGPGYLISVKEITEMKQQGDAIRASFIQMSSVIYNLPDATFAIDNTGKIIAWNRAMEILTGRQAADVLGKGNYEYALTFYGSRRPLLIDLIGQPDEKIQQWGYRTIRRKGNAVTAETPTTDGENRLRIIRGLAAPIFDNAGNRVGAIESIADVTERRQRESALEDSVVRFRNILDNVGTATIIIEEDDTISFVNPEFGRIVGYVRDEIEGKKKWMEFVVPEDVKSLQDSWRRKGSLEDGPVRHEIRFIRWDGDVRNAYITITRIPGTEKIVVAILDITDKIRAETAVQTANRKLNFLNGIIRHDILNQLTVLKGNLELARERNTDPAQGAVLDKELAATDAIQALITFTRDYQDIGIAPPEWQDLRTVLRNAAAGIRLGDVTLSLEIEGVEVYADRLLSRVFHNMVENAIRHGGRKTTRIRIFCQESFEELHVVCEDDGTGVPPEAKEKIFSRQFLNRTGLGLYLAREILSITGIPIRETGIYGSGACFELRVPKGGYRFVTAQD